ncbi:MAG: dienelactone hydrolase family protein [Myxococcales bacterium]|nr:dienelactone hydrolase family protein [Myxococcales bacterium]
MTTKALTTPLHSCGVTLLLLAAACSNDTHGQDPQLPSAPATPQTATASDTANAASATSAPAPQTSEAVTPATPAPAAEPADMAGGTAGAGAAEATPADDGAMPTAQAPTPVTASPLPTPEDYGATGPFADAAMFTNVGPGGNYTLFRPDQSLGRDGFKHPVVAWGNGITTTPPMYEPLLTAIASHGFVIIGTNDTTVERPAMVEGLEWLIEQNDVAGPLQGMLDISKEATIGYSWGGGAAIDTADRPNVLATVSFHGMPPRESDAFASMHAPLLLFTSTGDTFVNRAGYVQPNYDASTVQTALAEHEGYSHTTPLVIPGDAGDERAPAIAWLYLWLYGEQDARRFFYGDGCELCGGVWTDFDRKNWPEP